MTQPTKNLTRKTLIVDDQAIQTLKKILNTKSASKAVRIAVEDRLFAEEVFASDDRIIRQGGLEDVYHRCAPDSREKS